MSFLRPLANPLGAALAPLLPGAERRRLAAACRSSPLRWTIPWIAAGVLGGLWLFVFGAIDFIRSCGEASSDALLAAESARLTSADFGAGGIACYIAWLFQPRALLGLYLLGMATARSLHAVASGEALAEPWLWLPIAGLKRAAARRRTHRRERELGPWRPDRLEREPDGTLVIHACREKPDWNERVTIEVDGLHYRLAGLEERPDGRHRGFAYRLRPAPPGEVIRGLVAWRPGAASPSPAAPAQGRVLG